MSDKDRVIASPDGSGVACGPGTDVAGTRWQRQTKRGGGNAPPKERGDCVPACIASILGLPLAVLPNTHGDGWWDRLQAAVAVHGYGIGLLDIRFDPPDCYWMASVPSLTLPPEPDGGQAFHCIVVRGREFVHDPGLGDQYDAAKWVEAWNEGKVAEGWMLVPLDPATLEPKPAGTVGRSEAEAPK